MGWGRMFLLGNIGQQMDLEEHREEIGRLRDELGQAAGNQRTSELAVERLEKENAELKLYIATIFRILVSKKIVGPEELHDWIRTVDGEDGKIDNARSGGLI